MKFPALALPCKRALASRSASYLDIIFSQCQLTYYLCETFIDNSQ